MKEEEIQIFSPRVGAKLEKIKNIRELWPGETIVVVSEFVLFSDIINERIERRSKKDPNLRFRLAEYNDTINLEERSRIQYAFNLSSGGPEVVLLSAGAGGSHMVIAEPPWTPGKIDQVIGGGPIGFLKTNKSIYGT